MRLPDRLGFRGKTLWDWLQLLIVPAILIAVTFAWSATQTRNDNKREDRRINADRTAAEEARRDATLQTYLNQMSALMLEQKLLSSKPGDAVRAVARTVTLATLRRVGRERTVEVVRFLAEAGLLSDVNAGPAVNIRMVDLGALDFRGVDLSHLSLGALGLAHANFASANLDSANLAGADLAGANLSAADLDSANLSDANLEDANLSHANLSNAHLERVILTRADLKDALLGLANLEESILNGAKLTGARLHGTNLRLAHLDDADLRFADLQNADFKYADLTDADLTGASFDNTKLGAAANIRYAKRLDLGAYLTNDLSRKERRVYLDTHKAFLNSLTPEEFAKLNLTPEKLAKFRREASGG
jgi:uncharacterized protein YjbI with pentapeptide repeats